MNLTSVHQRSIVIDAVSPLLRSPAYIDHYVRGGVTAVCPTIAVDEDAAYALARIGEWHRLARSRSEVRIVRTAQDIRAAKAAGGIGIIPHFQNIAPLQANLDLVDGFGAAGIRMIQISYNVRGLAGDGCEEPSDAGLSRFGAALIERLEEAAIIVDCSHTGRRTTREAIAKATRPLVVSHANALAIRESPRNLDDETIRAIAEKGGLVGAVAFPPFVSPKMPPTLDEFIAHIEHLLKVGGTDHVGLGLDYYGGVHPFSSDEKAMAIYRGHLASGAWSDAYPPPPWKFPKEIATPDMLKNLTQALSRRGHPDSVVEKVIGGNWMRVFEEIWRSS